jgi:hypothetical protein
MQGLYKTMLKFTTAMHPQMDGQSEWVIQILEDMLHAYALDFRNKWIDNFAYVEFVYNDNFQSTIGMAPFEALYGQKYQSLLYWGRLS